eukprot:2379891-Rhodomonas_salina.1
MLRGGLGAGLVSVVDVGGWSQCAGAACPPACAGKGTCLEAARARSGRSTASRSTGGSGDDLAVVCEDEGLGAGWGWIWCWNALPSVVSLASFFVGE